MRIDPGCASKLARSSSIVIQTSSSCSATSDTVTSHIRMQEHLAGEAVTWLERVGDEQYAG
jgi:hypothetical protein